MGRRRIEGEKVPEYAPGNTNGPGRVEHVTPSKISDDEATQWISQTDAEAEPCTTTQNSQALRDGRSCSALFFICFFLLCSYFFNLYDFFFVYSQIFALIFVLNIAKSSYLFMDP